MPLRLIFMGTPDFAVPTLRALAEHDCKIVAVYTREAKPAGRGLQLQSSPVEQEAHKRGIPVFTPKTLRTQEALEEFRSHDADVAVVVAYGMILPQDLLDTPQIGCFNLHASLLPRWRGAAPIHRAIIEGDRKTGVMVMKMDAGLDTGDVAMKKSIVISNKMTVADLHDALASLGADLMLRAMNILEQEKRLPLTKQSGIVTLARKIEKAEARIDWNRSRKVVLRHINGLSPFPGAWCEVPIKNKMVRLKILRSALVPGPKSKSLPPPGVLLDGRLAVACADGAIRVLDLQLAGGPALKAEEFLRRTPFKPPMRFA